MMSNEPKTRIIENPFNMDIIEMALDNFEENYKRKLGKEQANWVARMLPWYQEWMNEQMPCFQGRWVFELFHSDHPVLWHTDTIAGNDGDIGFILPYDWEGHKPATIAYKWWTDRRVKYAGNNEIRYTDNDELALMVEDIPEVDLTFEWEKDKALLFDCRQLHTARKLERPAWKEFIIGFVV